MPKKRLERRAEWHFGDGAEYCNSCPEECADCPYQKNACQSLEGWQAWNVAVQVSPQIRDRFPLQEAFILSDALGYRREAMAELLPAISAGLTKAQIKNKD